MDIFSLQGKDQIKKQLQEKSLSNFKGLEGINFESFIWNGVMQWVGISMNIIILNALIEKQNRESTERCSRCIARKNNDTFGKRMSRNK